MKDFSEILGKLKTEDNLLNEILNVHFHRTGIITQGNYSYSKIKLLKIYPLINKIIQNQKEDLILVLPAKKEISYLSSIFAALTFYKNNFQERLDNFNDWLVPNTNVMLCSSGEESGKIYKYIGRKDDKFISLGSLVDKSIKIDHKIDTLLQLTPISEQNIKDKNIGKKGFIPKPTPSFIDEILNIKSYGNPMLYQNKIIVLTNFYSSYSNFLENEILLSNINQTNNDKCLSEIIKTGQIDEEGNIKDRTIEPLIVYTRDLGCIYEYSSKTENEKIIICDDVKKLNENYPIIQQIKDKNKKFKFLVFAEENEYEHVIDFNKKNNSEIWKFSDSEIKEFIKNIEHDDFNLNNSFPGRAYIKNKYHIEKKEIYLPISDTEFNKLDSKFKLIFKKAYSIDESKKTIVMDLIKNLYTKMYQLRDHIFGFPESLINETKIQIDQYFVKLNSTKSYLANDLYDDLVDIGNSFKKIPFENNDIFEKRVSELYENIKLREQDSKGDYAILAYNLPRKNYYKENIKKRWNVDAEVIYSIDTKRTFKNLIVPSELAQFKIIQLLLNDNFENIYFIGSKTLNEEINLAKSKLFNRWVNNNIDNEKKCDITGIDRKYKTSFFSPEQMKYQISRPINENTINFETYFHSNDLSKYSDESSSEDNAIKVPAFLVIFNGDSYAFFKENFSVEVFNSIFDPSAYEKKSKIVKKDYKTITFGDIILLRHRTDRDVLDQETIALLKNDKDKFYKLKKDTQKISTIINSCIVSGRTLLEFYLKAFKYDKNIGNVISMADLDGGTICPNSFSDLKKIFQACEQMSKTYDKGNYKYDEKEAIEIYNSAKTFKKYHLSAGFSISRKLKDAVRNSKDLEFDGNPLRVDYLNGEVIFGSTNPGVPEGYIVQVNNYEEPRVLKEVKDTSTNRLLFL